MSRLRTTQIISGRSFTRVKDPNLKRAKEETKHYVDLTPHLLNGYVKNHDSLRSSIKLQIGQTVFK